MVHDRLKGDPSINLVWFNTWQFSQFNMGEKLPLVMLGNSPHAIRYKAVTEFDTGSEENDAGLLEIICKAIDAVKKYFA